MESQGLSFFSYCSALKKDVMALCVRPSTLHRWGRNTIINVGIHCLLGTQPHVILSVGAAAALASVIHDVMLQMLVTLENSIPVGRKKLKFNFMVYWLVAATPYLAGKLFNSAVLSFVYLQAFSMFWRGEELSAQQLRDRAICFFLVGNA